MKSIVDTLLENDNFAYFTKLLVNAGATNVE